MSKTVTKAAPDAVETNPLEYVQSINQKPYQLNLIGPCNIVLNEMAVHVRAGYCPHPTLVPELFPHNGQMALVLVLGSPDPDAITRAKETAAHAMQMQEAAYARDVAQEAQRQLEQRDRDEAAKQRATAIAAAEAQIKALKLQAATL